MELGKSSPCLKSVWRPVWVTCTVLMFSGLHALVPNGERDNSIRTIPPILPGVQTTPLTTKSVSFEESFRCRSKGCEDYCTYCWYNNISSKTDCYKMVMPVCHLSFTEEMSAMNDSSWCMWDKVKSSYNTLTQCTEHIADCMLVPWPNKLVEELFVNIHTKFFQECPTENLKDPPPNIVFALVMTPICLIPAMVVLVVLKTKNGDRS